MCRKLKYGLVISWAPSPLGLNSLFFHSPLLLLVIVGYTSVSLFNTSVFSGCAFALGSQRALCVRGLGCRAQVERGVRP